MPIELLIEYVRLSREGDHTIKERCELLKEARERILEERRKFDEALEKMDYKISVYEKAVETGVLDWGENDCCCCSKPKE